MNDVSNPPAEGAWPASVGRRSRGVSRRVLVVGAGAAAVAAGGLVASRLASQPPSPPGAVTATSATPPSEPPTPPTTASSATPPASPVAARLAPAAGRLAVPEGYALVTSPRLPLFGVGPDDPDRLLRGTVSDWRAVGSAVPMPVEPLGLAGAIPPEFVPVATYASYDELATALATRTGGVALVPVEEVDFRVNVLAVAGFDPLRDEATGAEPTMRIAVVGDIVPGRNVHLHMATYGDYTRPFAKVAAHLAAYDLTIANLEGNLSATLAQPDDPHSFSFVSDPAMIDGFKLAGIDAVSLANNHSVWNEPEVGWGIQGLLDTIDALETTAMPYFGAGRTLDDARRPWLTEVNGVRLAILGIDGVTANHEVEPGVVNGVVDFDAAAGPDTAGTNPYDSSLFLADIALAAEQADVVIPYFHMGQEYVAVPPLWAVNGARAAIEQGASLVVTNHPHVIQGMEIYQGRPIVYSPGNFVLDQMWGVEVRSGLILDLTLRGKRVVGLRCHGVEIEEFHQPRLMTAGEHANLMDRFWAATDRQANR